MIFIGGSFQSYSPTNTKISSYLLETERSSLFLQKEVLSKHMLRLLFVIILKVKFQTPLHLFRKASIFAEIRSNNFRKIAILHNPFGIKNLFLQ